MLCHRMPRNPRTRVCNVVDNVAGAGHSMLINSSNVGHIVVKCW